MPELRDDVERYLAVGQVAVIQTEPNRKDGPRFPTTFLGWRRGRAVYIEHPRTPEGRDVAFRDGQHCVLRFIHDGQACAFTAAVIDWTSARGESQVRLRWPEQVETLVLRRFDRVPFHAPVRVRIANGTELDGQFSDLSIGGCGIVLATPITKGDQLQLTFSLPDGASIQNLMVSAKMTRQTADGQFVGCEFEQDQNAARNDIGLFVTAELARGRGGAPQAPSEPRVLIVDSNEGMAEKLRKLLARQHIEVLVTNSTVDTFYSVRAVPLHAVVICSDLPELSGLDVCRLIRKARGLEKLPIILYHGQFSGQQISEAGITKWLPDSPSLLTDIVLEIKQIAAPPPG